jgi:glycosyltransferase involved in cell wall biosynthesis
MPTPASPAPPKLHDPKLPHPKLAVVLKGYPRLSETFIAQELHALEARGFDLRLISLRRPYDPKTHPIHDEIRAPVSYLPEYLHTEPARVLRGWRAARRLPGYRAARRAFRADLKRDPTRNRLRRFGQACVLAAELPADVEALYVHFLHTPASVARYAAAMRGLPWSGSAHAKDVWTTPDWEIREKLAAMDWLATCTAVGRDHLAGLADDPGKVRLVYHGLDLARFPATPAPAGARDGGDPSEPVRLISVGRAVEKKGYDVLLRALARLPADLNWHLTHIGGGELREDLRAQAERLGLAERIDWQGPQAQADVLAAYRASDLFVLASRVAPDGDRDGLPNVLMEAQSQGLACLATQVSAIPELIRDGDTGRLVPPGDAGALADALAELIRDPARRQALGQAGAARVRTAFDAQAQIDVLADLLRGRVPTPAPADAAA